MNGGAGARLTMALTSPGPRSQGSPGAPPGAPFVARSVQNVQNGHSTTAQRGLFGDPSSVGDPLSVIDFNTY